LTRCTNLPIAPAGLRLDAQAMSEELPFSVVRGNSHDELLARAINLPIALGAYHVAVRLYPEDLIELRQGRAGDRTEQMKCARPAVL
jgi:hypothetical protein